MEMTTEKLDNGIILVSMAGRLDIAGAQQIDLQFSAIAGSQRKMIVDLEKVEFVASIGIRTLIVGAKSSKQKGGRMVLLHPAPAVEKVLVETGTDSIIPIVHDMDGAIAAVS